MSLFKTIGTPVTLALVLISSGALTAHACNPKPNSCCWEEGGTGWLTCSGECVDLNGAGTLCKPDYWGDVRGNSLPLAKLQRKYPELWKSMKARGSTRTIKYESHKTKAR
jgi:hypothetical protein